MYKIWNLCKNSVWLESQKSKERTYLSPAGVCGSWEKGYLSSGRQGTQVIILGQLGSKHILLEI